jgi:hypothetical protein
MQYSGVASPILAAADFMDAKVQPIAPPYSDQQTPSPICGATLGMNSNQNPSALSLSQGDTFTRLFPAQRAGRRMVTRGRMPHIKHRKNRKNSRKSLKNRKQRGGAATYPDSFDSRLPADLVGESRTGPLDKALADLPQFTGTYGLQTGGRRNSRKNRKASRKNRKASRKNRKASRKNRKASRKNRKASRKQRGGAYGDDAMSVGDSSKLLLSPEMERFAFVNPQFYNENVVNPNFVAPYSAYVASQK